MTRAKKYLRTKRGKFMNAFALTALMGGSVAAIEHKAEALGRAELQSLSDVAVLSAVRYLYEPERKSHTELHEIASDVVNEASKSGHMVELTLNITEFEFAETNATRQHDRVILGYLGVGPRKLSVTSKARLPSQEEILISEKCKTQKSRYEMGDICGFTPSR